MYKHLQNIIFSPSFFFFLSTCFVWFYRKRSRSQIVFANTLFKCVCYNKDETQIFTSGTDRKIGYWESYDGSLIRDLEGSKTGAVNAMDISPDGEYFVTGGDDKLLKVRSVIHVI